MRYNPMLHVLTVLGAASLAACGGVEGNYNSNNNSQPIDLCVEVTYDCDTAADD
ncbi:MAG: hypothetical protein JRE13_13125, partial [Deltaproteobacteria bacterium]|nr:hypothetical protein [Deltaproteobacteria bacterium]